MWSVHVLNCSVLYLLLTVCLYCSVLCHSVLHCAVLCCAVCAVSVLYCTVAWADQLMHMECHERGHMSTYCLYTLWRRELAVGAKAPARVCSESTQFPCWRERREERSARHPGW